MHGLRRTNRSERWPVALLAVLCLALAGAAAFAKELRGGWSEWGITLFLASPFLLPARSGGYE
jgi:hypothetical protein